MNGWAKTPEAAEAAARAVLTRDAQPVEPMTPPRLAAACVDWSSVWGRMPAPESYVALQINSDGTAREMHVVGGRIVAERTLGEIPDQWPVP